MESNDPKQVLIARSDLKVHKGKHVVQGAHAAVNAVLQLGERVVHNGVRGIFIPTGEGDTMLSQWLEGLHKKVCVAADSEAELVELFESAKARGINCVLVVDSGLTEFRGQPTRTAVALGPDTPERLDEVTGHLKLF